MATFTHEKRGSMTPQRALRIFEHRGGKCTCPKRDGGTWGCDRKLTPKDEWRVEHAIAFENGGTDDDENCWILCEWCWPEKDKDDHGLAAHGRGMSVTHWVPKSMRRKARFRR